MVLLPARGQRDHTRPRLSRTRPHFRRFDAMVNAVSEQVNERLSDLVQHGPVKFNLFSYDDQINILTLLLGKVANHSREPVEDLSNSHHAHLHYLIAQIVGQPVDIRHRFIQFLDPMCRLDL
uniref:Uncharacterized protein n=1 Tax=Candidatus Methanogaster sp. ANME-2c ERB4 TaxID=2759911 RepID=A0A7G9Y1F0_9EURY|nr:hypothetical protein ADJAJEDA_00003 [Methanosarcinales archaeon ANME-2c ERB4]